MFILFKLLDSIPFCNGVNSYIFSILSFTLFILFLFSFSFYIFLMQLFKMIMSLSFIQKCTIIYISQIMSLFYQLSLYNCITFSYFFLSYTILYINTKSSSLFHFLRFYCNVLLSLFMLFFTIWWFKYVICKFKYNLLLLSSYSNFIMSVEAPNYDTLKICTYEYSPLFIFTPCLSQTIFSYYIKHYLYFIIKPILIL